MENPYRLSETIMIDLNRILSVAAVPNGVRLTHINGTVETITPLALEDRNRLFDQWLGIKTPEAKIG